MVGCRLCAELAPSCAAAYAIGGVAVAAPPEVLLDLRRRRAVALLGHQLLGATLDQAADLRQLRSSLSLRRHAEERDAGDSALDDAATAVDHTARKSKRGERRCDHEVSERFWIAATASRHASRTR